MYNLSIYIYCTQQ